MNNNIITELLSYIGEFMQKLFISVYQYLFLMGRKRDYWECVEAESRDYAEECLRDLGYPDDEIEDILDYDDEEE